MRMAIAAAICAALAGTAQAQGVQPETSDELAKFTTMPATRGIFLAPPRVMLDGLPRPGNQGRTGTSVGWAAAYAASALLRTKLAGQMLSPAFTYALSNGDASCLASTRISQALDTMRDVGALPLAQYSFDPGWCGRVPSAAERQRAAAYRIPGWAVMPAKDPVSARTALARGHVVIVSLPIGPAFAAHRGSGVFDMVEDAGATYWQALVAIGYDDQLGAFRIETSAGPDWGDGGMAWLSYRVWRERSGPGYVILDPAPQSKP
jgi:cathepsin K